MSDAGTELEAGVGDGGARDTRMDGIPLNEPVFILRAADPLAAPTIRHWCEVHALNPDCPPRMLNAARAIAAQMDQWPGKNWPRR